MLDDAGRRWIRLTVRTCTLESDIAIPDPPPHDIYTTIRKLVGLPDDVALDGAIADGNVLTDASSGIRSTPHSEVAIAVEAGPDCGRVLPLGDGPITIGRARDNTITIADPGVSRHHLVARYDPSGLQIMPVATTNPLRVDGTPTAETVNLAVGRLLTIGNTGLRIVAVLDPARSKPHAPSPGHGADGEPVLDVPTAPDPPRPRSLSVAALLVPVLVAGGLVALTGSWMYLSLCAFGPMTALATYFTDKRNGKRRSRNDRRAYRRARARFDDELAAALATERNALDRQYPDLAAVFPSNGDRTVRLGTADLPASVTFSGPSTGRNPDSNPNSKSDQDSEPSTGPGREPPVLSAAPVGLNLAVDGDRAGQQRCRDIAIAGEPATADALARAVVLQLCRKNDAGPLRLVLADPDDPRWAWTRWLPHRRAGPSADSTVVFVANSTSSTFPDEPGGILRIRPGGHPDEAVVSCADGNFARPGGMWPGRLPLGDIGLDLVSIRTAESWARQIGRNRSGDDAPAGIPSSVLLGGLVRTDTGSLTRRWRRRTPETSCAIGRTATGTLLLDLVRDGPHIMVAGTTGAGKSELLQTLVFSLAAGNDPRDLQFVLFDFKGGSGLRFAAELPHTVGTVTDLDEHLALRAFTSLQAELRRRERVFAAAGVQEFDELDPAPASGADGRDDVPARLVIVIDEFRVLAEEQPDLLADVVRMVSVGRSLGVHLVLATQRPAGIVSADMQANINARISLRVRDVADSREVIDAPDAARLSADLPGRAFLRTGGDRLVEFQTARTETGPTSPPAPAEPRLLLPSDPLWRHADRPSAPTLQPVDIDGFRRAAEPKLQLRRPWLPPLPDAVTADELAEPVDRRPGRTSGKGIGELAEPCAPLGLGDDPAAAARVTVTWTPATDGNLMLLGTTRSGRTETLRVAACAFAAASSPAHVYVLDGAGGLSGLSGLPAVGARVTLAEPDRAVRIIERVQQEAVRTGRVGDTAQDAAPIVLIVDGWETWQPVLESYDAAAIDMLVTVSRTGPGAGIYVLVSGDRPLAVSKLGSTIGNKVLLRQSDKSDLLLHGIAKAAIPRIMPAGRGLAVGAFDGRSCEALEVQLSRTTPALYADAAEPRTPAPFAVRPLPGAIGLGRLGPARAGRVPIGIGGDDLVPVCWNTTRHFLIAGPAGSGKTTALAVIARQCAHAGIPVWTPSDTDAPGSDRPLVLIDDIDSLAPATERELADLVLNESLVVAASGSADRLASAFTGLAATVKTSRHGILLSPSRPMDGEVFGVRVRVPPAGAPGRGLYFDSARPVPVRVAEP